jgi:hypothetical protein
MPAINPSDVHSALVCALDLPETASPADLSAAVENLDGPGALAALQTLADLLNLRDEGAGS